MSSKRTRQVNVKSSGSVSSGKSRDISSRLSPGIMTGITIFSAVAYFIVVCLSSTSTIKAVVLLLAALSLVTGFLGFERLRERFSLPMVALGLVVLMDGISIIYARSGKFALYEFLKVILSFCLALILISTAPKKSMSPSRWIASLLSGCAAIAGIVSIDLISTHIISSPVLSFLKLFTPDYENLSGVEEGVRMLSIFNNPNIFAGCIGIGVILALGLTLTSKGVTEKNIYLSLLYINSLAFVLAFSMGASGIIMAAFIVWIAIERKERRPELIVLMVETLALTLLGAAIIFGATSFRAWDGVQPIPMLCLVAGAAALCAVDRFAGEKVAGKLKGKAALVLAIAMLLVLAVFAVLAYNVTGAANIPAGEWLRRAAYPEPGSYKLNVTANGTVNVMIESQDRRETMMHTSKTLYEGSADGASFEVPEESLVVYFNFSAPDGANLEKAVCEGANGTVSIPLGYKLLPGFIANRLQGLFANENAIQRVVFFSDGLKLFKKSPIKGLGMGSFENGIKGVQSFYYETKYAHNHYIQILAETGIAGLILFVGLLGISAFGVFSALKKEDADPIVPALGAALIFMVGHAAVEVVFSANFYLPFAFGVFALISTACGDALPRLGKNIRLGFISASAALMVFFCVLLVRNIMARRLIDRTLSLNSVPEAVRLDAFEWADHMFSYVTSVMEYVPDGEIREQADEYAERLSEVDSNNVPISLAEYYFRTERPEEGLRMVEKYVDYVSSDPSAWQLAFAVLQQYEQPDEAYREGVLKIGQMLDDWNAQNMGDIALGEELQAFLDRMRAG